MRTSHLLTRALLALVALLLLSTVSLAQTFVYTNNNITGPNTVTGFSVNPATGAMTLIPGSPFATGGIGSVTGFRGANRVNSIVIGGFLYVANGGSNNISVFRLDPATGVPTLIPGSPFATGAAGASNDLTLAVTPNLTCLFAGTRDTVLFTGSLSTFSIAPNGALTLLGAPTPLAGEPDGIKVSPNGRFLAVSLPNLNQVLVFTIGPNCSLTPAPGSPFPASSVGLGAGPAGLEFNAASNLLFVGEANPTNTQVDVFSVAASGALTPIVGSPFIFASGVNSNSVTLSPDQTKLFVSNQFSNTITVLNVAANGTLSLVAGSPFANPGTPVGNEPQNMVTNREGTLLFVNNTNGTVSVFSISPTGAVAAVAGSPFAAGSSARPGIAIFQPVVSSAVSDQKAGSVLFYNLYTSNPADLTRQNTRLNLTNIHPTQSVAVHLFFVDGNTCTPADAFVCLTPSQTMSFLASDFDPGTTGYIVAVASDPITGCPINFNFLIGDEFIKLSSGHTANLGAESFAAIAPPLPCGATVTLNFDGVSYDQAPRVLAVDNFPSPADGNNTLLILNRVGGDLSSGGSFIGALFGVLYDEAEQPFSFSIAGGNVCQLRNSLSNNFPRIVGGGLNTVIPTGRSGWLRLGGVNDIGLLGAMINFNATAGVNNFNQGHNLHKLTFTSASLTIPVIAPNCQ